MDKEERYELLEQLYKAVNRLRATAVVDDDFPAMLADVDRLMQLIGDL